MRRGAPGCRPPTCGLAAAAPPHPSDRGAGEHHPAADQHPFVCSDDDVRPSRYSRARHPAPVLHHQRPHGHAARPPNDLADQAARCHQLVGIDARPPARPRVVPDSARSSPDAEPATNMDSSSAGTTARRRIARSSPPRCPATLRSRTATHSSLRWTVVPLLSKGKRSVVSWDLLTQRRIAAILALSFKA